ncbi:MAG: protein jag [Acidimicrobiales bacterium]
MEWVEKTGRSVDEAKERAFDQLGVAEKDAEWVVLAEPKTGLFGRVRGEARVRARVRPAEPRPKRSRRQRDRERAGSGGSGGRSGESTRSRGRTPRRGGADAGGARERPQGAAQERPQQQQGAGTTRRSGEDEGGPAGESAASRRRKRRRSGARTRPAGSPGEGRISTGDETASEADDARHDAHQYAGLRGSDVAAKEDQAVADGITLQEQGAAAKEFLEGLLDRYGFEAQVDVRELDEETVELAAHGEGLGVLVGPKGATVAALQDVTRTVMQKHFPNRTDRILVDVAGYRERRAAALRRFTAEVAAEVLGSGSERPLEPMSPADRKVVHDTVVTIEGVVSSSQGEEPHRFVVISPAS